MRTHRLTWFDAINGIVLALIGISTVIPFIHVTAKSFSSQYAVMAGRVYFHPIGLQLDSYKFVLFQSGFFNAFQVSVFVTVVGTLLSLVITAMAAYPLSKTEFVGRKFILLLYVFSMLFYGGIVPSYLLMKSLSLLDTVWSIIIPYLVVPFNLFVIKTFFEGLPDGVEESAKIDGASNMRILFSIVLPISLPVLATIGLFYAVSYWNNFFHPLLFISKPELKPLQIFLYDMINSTSDYVGKMSVEDAMNVSEEGVRAATIIVSTLPIVMVYPFLQRYFVKGLTIGSVKG